jgi:hypothetical protein
LLIEFILRLPNGYALASFVPVFKGVAAMPQGETSAHSTLRWVFTQTAQSVLVLGSGALWATDRAAGLCIAAAYQAGNYMVRAPLVPLVLGYAFIGTWERLSGTLHSKADVARVAGKVPFIQFAFAVGLKLSDAIFHKAMEHDDHMPEGHHHGSSWTVDMCKFACLAMGMAVAIAGAVLYEMAAQRLIKRYYDRNVRGQRNDGIEMEVLRVEGDIESQPASPVQPTTDISRGGPSFVQQTLQTVRGLCPQRS